MRPSSADLLLWPEESPLLPSGKRAATRVECRAIAAAFILASSSLPASSCLSSPWRWLRCCPSDRSETPPSAAGPASESDGFHARNSAHPGPCSPPAITPTLMHTPRTIRMTLLVMILPPLTKDLRYSCFCLTPWRNRFQICGNSVGIFIRHVFVPAPRHPINHHRHQPLDVIKIRKKPVRSRETISLHSTVRYLSRHRGDIGRDLASIPAGSRPGRASGQACQTPCAGYGIPDNGRGVR